MVILALGHALTDRMLKEVLEHLEVHEVVEIGNLASLPAVMRERGGVRYGSSRPRKLRDESAQAADKHRPVLGGRTGCRRLSRRQHLPLRDELRLHVPSTEPLRQLRAWAATA
jgi:hypothetical protein